MKRLKAARQPVSLCKPVRMEDLPDEPGYKEFGDFLAYGPAPFVVEATQTLFGGFRARGKA